VHSSRRGSRDIEHIGSAHDEVDLAVLKSVARQPLAAGRGELEARYTLCCVWRGVRVCWRDPHGDKVFEELAQVMGEWCMDNHARRASVIALGELGHSEDYRDRADAGRGLAGFAEIPEAREMLLDLILDADDTFVTRATAEALLRRKDVVGLATVAAALAVADPNHGDGIHTAVTEVLGVFSRDRDAALQECETLTQDPDERVRRGADQLIDMLAEIDPVLFAVQGD